ncbi:MAG: hypothetical protein HOP29_11350 [Phycisphaerales bacterium]|nr:hypothetical protein [Phycisphaerales bacterium]
MKAEPTGDPPLGSEESGPSETIPAWEQLPVPKPLREAVAHGVFGLTEEGPIDPDEEDVRALTEEHARQLIATLADAQAVEDALRTGEDPRTGRVPKTQEARKHLAEFLARENTRLKNAYSSALAAYAGGFGGDATHQLDHWVRKNVAGGMPGVGRYDPGHPWHYYHEGDNAPPIPVDEIEPNLGVGRFIERELPKNRAKRAVRLRELLQLERERVENDKRRYQEIVERGAEALSRYDREIAHTSDELARATALSLKFSHIGYGLGRVAWLESQIGSSVAMPLLGTKTACIRRSDS